MEAHRIKFAPTLLFIKGLRVEYRYSTPSRNPMYRWNDWVFLVDSNNINRNFEDITHRINSFFPLVRSNQWQIEEYRNTSMDWSGWKYKSLREKSGKGSFKKVYHTTEISCTCPDKRYRKKECKHIKARNQSIMATKIDHSLFGQNFCLISSYM